MFTFTHEQFSGPLDLLMQLIDDEKLSVTDVSLAQLTDSYIQHVHAAEAFDEAEVADFLVIAAKLLYLKSRQLLPSLVPDAEDASDLERQLKMYERFVHAAESIRAILERERVMYPREPVTIRLEGFQPPRVALTPERLAAVMRDVTQRYHVEPLPEVAVQRVMSIKEKIEAVQDLLTTMRRGTLHDFVSDPKNKHDIIVTFLALLELVKQRSVSVSQNEHFDHIHIASV